jgi:UDP-glucose 4-epimerase
MELKSSKILVIGGAGFIGSFVVAELLKEEVAEFVVYDDFRFSYKIGTQRSLTETY